MLLPCVVVSWLQREVEAKADNAHKALKELVLSTKEPIDVPALLRVCRLQGRGVGASLARTLRRIPRTHHCAMTVFHASPDIAGAHQQSAGGITSQRNSLGAHSVTQRPLPVDGARGDDFAHFVAQPSLTGAAPPPRARPPGYGPQRHAAERKHPRLITCGLMKTSTSIMTTAFLRLCLCAGRWTVQQLDVLAAVCLADSRRMRRRILTGLVSVAAPAGLYI